MKILLKIYILLFVAFLSHAQTVNISALNGNMLPLYGSSGVTFSTTSSYASGTSGVATAWVWYKRTNGTDVQILTGTNKVTLFAAGDYYVKVTHRVFNPGMIISEKNSSLFTVLTEIPAPRNTIISTVFQHQGIKDESDLLLPTAGNNHGINSISYSDGLGRPTQSVLCQSSPGKLDIVQPIAYEDVSGRSTTSYLAYTNGISGKFHTAAISEQQSFYNTSGQKRATSTVAKCSTAYENSPIGTMLEQGDVGNIYQIGTGKTSKFTYRSNIVNEVVSWTFNSTTTQATGNSFFPASIISVKEAVDAQKQMSMVFTNVNEQILLKKQKVWYVWDDSYIETDVKYYVYDAKGRLVYEVPFKATTSFGALSNWTFNSNSDICKGLMHYYQYDDLDRVWYHRAPGADPVYSIYDRMNRPVLTQNGQQRPLNQWSFVKYDNLGRTVITGLYTDNVNTSPAQLQTLANAETVLWEKRASGTPGYTENLSFPRTGTNKTVQILSVQYFDDYDFNSDGLQDIAFKDEPTLPNVKPDYNVTGKPVASKLKVIGSTDERWIWKVGFFDEIGNLIQTRSNSHLSSGSLSDALLTNRITILYDFNGKVLQSIETHLNTASSTQAIVIKKRFVYDHAGRLLEEHQQNNNDGEVQVKELRYNELGQVIEKNLHKTQLQSNFIQSIDYTYNINGKLTHINNPELANGYGSNNDDISDKFGMQIYYEDFDPGFYNLPEDEYERPEKRYDGRVTSTRWKTMGQDTKMYVYAYFFDLNGRLGRASQFDRTNSPTTWIANNKFSEEYGYDESANITLLKRSNSQGQITDHLNYNYKLQSNIVEYIQDLAGSAEGFKQNSTILSNAYEFDKNGNLTEDKNKRITITYNHMNLVSSITWKNSVNNPIGTMTYTYSADGRMLQKKNQPLPGTAKVVDYIDGFCYKDNGLQFFNTSEGRVSKYLNGTLHYEYEIKDHQGYTRVNFTDSNDDGIAEVIQENHFYPSGLLSSSWVSGTALDQFKLQGKEFQDDGFGGNVLTWYDFGARMYDPQVMRWWAQDPMYQYDSPYAYCGNDPVNGYDPNGMWNIWDDIKVGLADFESWAAQNENKIIKPVIAGHLIVGGAILCFTPAAALGAAMIAGGVYYYYGVADNMSKGASWEEANKYAVLGVNVALTIPQNQGQPTQPVVDPGAPQPSSVSPSSASNNPYGLFDQNGGTNPTQWTYVVQTNGKFDVGHAFVISPNNYVFEVNRSNGKVDVKSMGYKWDIKSKNDQQNFMGFNGGRASNFKWVSVHVPDFERAMTYFLGHTGGGWDYKLLSNNCKHYTIIGLQAGGAFIHSGTGPIPNSSPMIMPYALTPYKLPK